MSPSKIPSITNGVNGYDLWTDYPDTEPHTGPYRILEQYHSKRTRLRVASIGAGASGNEPKPFLKTPLRKLGLCLAYKMEKMLRPGTWDLTLFEKNPHLGGTWYENTWVPFEAKHGTQIDNGTAIRVWHAIFRLISTLSHSIPIQTGLNSLPAAQKSRNISKTLQTDMTPTST